MKRLILLVGVLLLGLTNLWASELLKIIPSGRSAALGDAYSLTEDIYTLYTNPAGLSQLKKMQLGFGAGTLTEDIYYGMVSIGIGNKTGSGLALGINYLNYGQIPGRETASDTVRNFTAVDTIFTLGWGKRITDSLSFGLTGKIIQEQIDTAKSSPYTIDFGLLGTSGDRFSWGISVHNIAGQRQFTGDDTVGKSTVPIPLKARIGLNLTPLPNLLLCSDVIYYITTQLVGSIGVEYKISLGNLVLPLRFGWNSLRQNDIGLGISAGLGLSLGNKLEIDLAWVPYNQLGDTYRTTITLKF